MSRDFCFWFFYESVSPQPQSIPLGSFRIFSKIRGDTGGNFATGVKDTGGKLPPVSTTPAANFPPVSTTPAANFATSSPCAVDTGEQYQAADTLKWTWRQKFIYILTLLPKGAQTKILKFFCLKIFSICHLCRWHRWCTLSREYLSEFSKKIRNARNGILRCLGETDSWKKPEVENLVTLSL